MGIQLSSCNAWNGKTIEKADFDYDDSILIKFTDGDYAKIYKEKDQYSDHQSLHLYADLTTQEKVFVGLIPQQEYDTIVAKQRLAADEENKKWRLEQYEKLRKEFES